VDSKDFGGLAEVSVRGVDHSRDEALIELLPGIVVVDAFLHHLGDELIE
jgi:hypothetical protein